MSQKIRIFFLLVFLTSLSAPTGTLQAQKFELNLLLNSGFNPNYLLSDGQLTNSAALTPEDVQKFLESKPGVLGTTKFIDLDGQEKLASEIIFKASQNYRVNPQVILALLQKEQSLIENPRPTAYNFDWATGYGRCDSCDQNDPNIAKFKGFATQVDSAAGALRFYLDNSASQNWFKRPGILYSIDSIPVIPANLASAILYNYTPHLEGNYNFWQIWQKWFNKMFPDGSIVKDKDGDQIWLIQAGKRRLFASRAAFYSRFDAKKVVVASSEEIEKFLKGPAIKYPNFALLKSKKGQIYLLVNDKKRLIDKQAFRYFGFNAEEIIKAADEDLAAYAEAEPIVIEKKYPLGIAMQNSKDKTLYYVADNVKHPIYDKKIIAANFKNLKLRQTETKTLNKFTLGEPIKFNDGTLLKIKRSEEIFFISNGERRLIADPSLFDLFGWQKTDIIATNEKTFALHPPGEPIILFPASPAAVISLNQ